MSVSSKVMMIMVILLLLLLFVFVMQVGVGQALVSDRMDSMGNGVITHMDGRKPG